MNFTRMNPAKPSPSRETSPAAGRRRQPRPRIVERRRPLEAAVRSRRTGTGLSRPRWQPDKLHGLTDTCAGGVQRSSQGHFDALSLLCPSSRWAVTVAQVWLSASGVEPASPSHDISVILVIFALAPVTPETV